MIKPLNPIRKLLLLEPEDASWSEDSQVEDSQSNTRLSFQLSPLRNDPDYIRYVVGMY